MDIEDILSLTISYSDKLYKLLKFDKIVNDYDFVKKLATDKAKMGLCWLKDIRFYERFIKDIQEKYKNLNIEKIRQNIYLVEHEEIEFMYIYYNLINYKELLNMKFDLIIMNPPYDGNLHLKILEKVIPVADKVVNISPANQFFAAKRLLKEYPLIQKSKVLKNNIVNIELIAPEIASNIFNASFAGPLMILTYDANCKHSLNYMDYNVIPYNLRSVFDKTIRACNDKILPNLYDEIIKNTNKKFILPCPEVHGNQGKADWAEITSSDYERALKAKQRWNWHLSFDTEVERKNCYNAWHTRFHQFIHSLIKADNFNYYGQLPWLNDYSQPWTDKRFCEYFGITGYIDDEHAEPGSEWEIILNTMKEYK